MFRIGQKVVCVKANYQYDCPPPYPVVGTIATVSWTGVSPATGWAAIDLVEYPSPETETYFRGYRASDWRPVVERKTDISIFKAMLTPQGVKA